MQPRDKLVMQILALSVAAFANVNTKTWFTLIVYLKKRLFSSIISICRVQQCSCVISYAMKSVCERYVVYYHSTARQNGKIHLLVILPLAVRIIPKSFDSVYTRIEAK